LDVDQSLTGEGNSSGYGFNLALHYKTCEWLSLGISYISQVRQKIKGDADFSKPHGIPASLFKDTKASGEIRLPDMVFVGLVFYPVDRLSLEISGVWTGWSTYDRFTVDYTDPILPGLDSVTQDKHWNDVWRLQLGAEYQALDWFDLRLGYVRGCRKGLRDHRPAPRGYRPGRFPEHSLRRAQNLRRAPYWPTTPNREPQDQRGKNNSSSPCPSPCSLTAACATGVNHDLSSF